MIIGLKKVTGMIKDEIGRKSMTEIVALRANRHDHRKLDKSKKIRAARVQKMCSHRQSYFCQRQSSLDNSRCCEKCRLLFLHG